MTLRSSTMPTERADHERRRHRREQVEVEPAPARSVWNSAEHDVGRVGAEHQHLAVGHVDHAHQAERDREPERREQQHAAEAQAVEEVARRASTKNALRSIGAIEALAAARTPRPAPRRCLPRRPRAGARARRAAPRSPSSPMRSSAASRSAGSLLRRSICASTASSAARTSLVLLRRERRRTTGARLVARAAPEGERPRRDAARGSGETQAELGEQRARGARRTRLLIETRGERRGVDRRRLARRARRRSASESLATK